MSHPKPPPSDQQYSLDNNLASWLGSPKHVYASWIHRKSLRTSTKIVYIAMFNRYVDWLADEHQIPFHLSTPKLISTFLDSSNPNQSKSRQKPMTSRQRQQYVRLIEHAFDEMGRLGLNIPNPGRLAGFAKIGKGKDDDTRFLNLVEREKLVAFVQTRTDELRKAKAGLEEWVEYRDLALVGVLVGAGLKVGQAKSLSLNCIRAGVRKADVNGLGAGLEPICNALQIAPSTYHLHAARRADPDQRSARAQRDEFEGRQIQRVWNENFQVYGVRKVWRQLLREGLTVARSTVARLMRQHGLKGVVRGKPVRTTFSDKATPCPLDRVNRQFRADRPNALWVSDFTYVSTWQGFVYVAFVIDVFARRIVGWKMSCSARTDFVLDALEQALHARRPVIQGGLIHHSDRGVQPVSIRYTERLAEAGIEPSVGSVGDSYDNALAETINGLYKAEVIHLQSWKNREAVELATLTWVDWFNYRRLLETIGNVPPAEAEADYYHQLTEFAMAA